MGRRDRGDGGNEIGALVGDVARVEPALRVADEVYLLRAGLLQDLLDADEELLAAVDRVVEGVDGGGEDERLAVRVQVVDDAGEVADEAGAREVVEAEEPVREHDGVRLRLHRGLLVGRHVLAAFCGARRE